MVKKQVISCISKLMPKLKEAFSIAQFPIRDSFIARIKSSEFIKDTAKYAITAFVKSEIIAKSKSPYIKSILKFAINSSNKRTMSIKHGIKDEVMISEIAAFYEITTIFINMYVMKTGKYIKNDDDVVFFILKNIQFKYKSASEYKFAKVSEVITDKLYEEIRYMC